MKRICTVFLLFALFCSLLTFAQAATVRVGDADGDGDITARDARIALRLSVGLDKASYAAKIYADTDANGEITAKDARNLLRVSVGLESESELSTVNFKNPTFSRNPDSYHLTEITIYEGESVFLPGIACRADEAAVWENSAPTAVSLSENRQVTALKKGFSCIICTVGNEKFYFAVTVISEVQEKINTLRTKYPDGYYWNAYEKSEKYPAVTETPCSDHASGGYSMCIGQCWGFANLISDEVFGESAPYTTGVTAETMKIGDHIRTSHHSVIIIDLIRKGDVTGYDYYNNKNITATKDKVIVVHCNWYGTCSIMWDYDYTSYIYNRDTVNSQYSYTRY